MIYLLIIFARTSKPYPLRWESSKMYQQQLEYQLAEQEDAKRAAYEEFLKEKLLIDEIVRKIYDEDLREAEDRLKKQQQV